MGRRGHRDVITETAPAHDLHHTPYWCGDDLLRSVWVFRKSSSRRFWTEASDRVTVSTSVASSCRGRGVITR
eukprot:scaffold44017_cov72-Phaeocystis_antarctica.AAC.1